jgi:drug/metabolite transporter (DMT)-like permease
MWFQENKPFIALFVSIISVSFAAIFITTLIDVYNTSPLSIAFFRLFFTTLIILPFVFFNKKTRNEIKNIPRNTFLIMIGIGIVLAAHFALWISSLELTSIASSVLLVTAHPIFVGPISHFFFKEKLSLINTIGLFFSIFGVFILVMGNYGLGSFTIDSIEGNILAWLGGLAAGIYILGGRKIRKTVSVKSYALVVYSFGTIVLFFICIFYNAPLHGFNIEIYTIILLMAIISGIFGHTLYNWSLEHVRASIASVALLGEPLGSSLLAISVPWIQQIPSNYTMLGGAFILTGIYMTAKMKKAIKKN